MQHAILLATITDLRSLKAVISILQRQDMKLWERGIILPSGVFNKIRRELAKEALVHKPGFYYFRLDGVMVGRGIKE